VEVMRTFFSLYFLSFSSFHGPSVSMFFRSFIPLIIHSAKFVPLLLSSCNVTFCFGFPVSCYHHTPALKSFFLVVSNQLFTPPSSYLTGGWKLMHRLSFITFFGLVTAMPLYFYISFDFSLSLSFFLHLATTIDSTTVLLLSTLQCIIIIKKKPPLFITIVHFDGLLF